MLHDFLAENRAEIIARARSMVAARWAPQATTSELQDGIPLFLEQLIETLQRSMQPNPAMATSAAKHGGDLLKMGFSIAQVVRDYGDLCQAVTELAILKGAAVTVDEFRNFNRCLDDAIADAVTEYTRLREHSITDRETERLGSLAHELRNCLSAATLAFQMLQGGKVSIGGSTGAVLERSLRRMQELLARTMAAVRIDAGLLNLQRVSVRRLIEDLEVEGAMEAAVRGLRLTVTPVAAGVDVEADEPLLAAAITNVLQNALKFTRTGGHVTLRTQVTAERVVFEIEDECGGLPPGKAEGLFRPFEQRGGDRSGMGLGLAISRKGIEANAGEIHVHDLPGKGCVFTIDLPRCPARAGAVDHKEVVTAAERARRVLIVDNEVDAARALLDILTLEGYDTRMVHTGAAALRLAPEFVPEVVLLDLGLPGLDGYAVARVLREVLGPAARLVATTGFQEDRVRLADAGFDAHLLKPIAVAALLTLLDPQTAA